MDNPKLKGEPQQGQDNVQPERAFVTGLGRRPRDSERGANFAHGVRRDPVAFGVESQLHAHPSGKGQKTGMICHGRGIIADFETKDSLFSGEFCP